MVDMVFDRGDVVMRKVTVYNKNGMYNTHREARSPQNIPKEFAP